MKNDISHDTGQHGFTLIELMISLVLGLLISAAVMQVFLTSQRVDRIQTAGSEIQDKAVFGLQAIEQQVRLANLGNDGITINDTTAMGGIVLTAGNYAGGNGEDDNDKDDNNKDDNDKDDNDKDDNDKDDNDKDDNDKDDNDKDDNDKDDNDKNDNDKNDNDKNDNDKDDNNKKEQLEDEAEDLEEAAEDLEEDAEDLEEDADDLPWYKWREAKRKRKEAIEKRKEAAEKRAEAARKRAEAAKIGKTNAYNFRAIQTPEFQQANFQISDFQRPVFQRASLQRLEFQRINFQKVALPSASGLFNVMVKGGLGTGYLTRSSGMTSGGSGNKWNSSLSNTNKSSDQLTIQYINTTGQKLFDCEGEEIEPGAHVITRYFVSDGGGSGKNTRKNLNLRCDAGRIKSDGTLESFKDSGQTIIENIDQFNIRLGVQRTLVDDGALTYQYADMTVAEYMELNGQKPAITNIRIAILARSTANSPEASADGFEIFGTKQTLKEQANAPKYLRRVYESNILLRNARVMRIVETTVVI